MKKLAVILWVLALSFSAFAGISRSEMPGKFDLSYENASLATVLNDISTFSSQNFVFKKSDLSRIFVTLNEEGVALKTILNSVLSENNFEFENFGKGILSIRPMTLPVKEAAIAAVAPVARVVDVEELVQVTAIEVVEEVAGAVELLETITEAEPVALELSPSVLEKLIAQLEDPDVATTVAQFQKRHVTWLQAEGFSMDQAVEFVRSASAAELLIQAQM